MSVEVVPSRSLTEAVRDGSLFFSLSVLHVKCSREVGFVVARGARSLFVHHTRIFCVKATQLSFR